MTTILQSLAAHCAATPDKPLYTFLDGRGDVRESYTYAAFDQRTRALAAGLQHRLESRAEQRVLLVYPPGLEFVLAFFACVRLGAIPVPVAPPDASGFPGGVARLAAIAGDTGARIVLTCRTYQQHWQALAERHRDGVDRRSLDVLDGLGWHATDDLSDDPDSLETPARQSLLFLQYTSGSTQQPRGVMVSHANVLHNTTASLDHTPIGVSWLPHYHDMGLIGYYLHIAMAGGSMIGFAPSQFLRRPVLWLQTITRYHATISSAPNFAFEYCLRKDKISDESLSELDLSSVQCLMNASEPARASTFERFQARFAACGLSSRAHCVYYGLAENTLAVTGGGRTALSVNTGSLARQQLRVEHPVQEMHQQTRLMSCGQPAAGIDVRIVPPGSCQAADDGVIGEIWIAGRSKAMGYLNRPALSQSIFSARLHSADSVTDYLRSGDIGFLRDGELYVCGRLKDMVVIAGRNYYPADIEAVVEASSSSVRVGGVAAFGVDKGDCGEGMVVVAEVTRAGEMPDLDALCRAIRQQCLLDVDCLAIVPRGEICRTTSGKIARHRCRLRWQDGEMSTLSLVRGALLHSDNSPVDQLLMRFDACGVEDCALAELGVDSLTLVELSRDVGRRISSAGVAAPAELANALDDMRILQSMTIGELRQALAALDSARRRQKAALGKLQRRIKDISQQERSLMIRDAILPADIRPAAASITADATVLLTGATGFLGAYLLEALLRLTHYRVLTLVRADDETHALRRSLAALERTGLLNPSLRQAFASRVSALAGDLCLPRFGLSAVLWAELATDVSAIYHSGAEVDYVRPYQSLRESNVSGTLEVLRLASLDRPKAVHHASTTFMFGFVARDICREDDHNRQRAGLNFGYAQTKWVAEQLVQAASARGLTTRIYRPSLITACGRNRYVRGDLMARVLAFMINHRLTIDSVNQLSLLPVDVCANNMVALSLSGSAESSVLHLTADQHYSMPDVCRAITEQHGYSFRTVSLQAFVEYMSRHCGSDEPLYPLVPFFRDNWHRIHLMQKKRYDNSGYRRARTRALSIVPEPPLAQTVTQIVRFLRDQSLIPAPLHTSAVML